MEWVSGNILIRPMKLTKHGPPMEGHKHNFDHTSIVFKGTVHVSAILPNGQVIERDFGEGAPHGKHFLVKADVTHKIIALTDEAEVWCVYAHRTPQGDVVQHFDGWMDAYF